MFDVDVAIIGAGPAGASTALHLVRAEGLPARRILLLDKARHPREKPCAGAISEWGISALAAIGVPLDVPHVDMRGVRILSGPLTGPHEARQRLGVIVRRNEFDASLFHRAAGDGVLAHDGEKLLDMARVPGGWELTTSAGTWKARFVAACDGAGSTVRKLLGIGEVARKGHLYVLETGPNAHDVGVARGLCDFDLSPADEGLEGYYWDFPTVMDGRPAVSRGIYHANFTHRRDVKEQLGRALAARGIDMAACTLKPFSTRPFVKGAPLARAHLVLVGEAAGVDATTGEGIAQAILFGGLAARHLADAVRTGRGDFEAYARAVVSARFGRRLLQSAWLAQRVYGPGGARWRRFLAGSPLAREAGARWYEGARLPWTTKGRLAFGLAWALLARG